MTAKHSPSYGRPTPALLLSSRPAARPAPAGDDWAQPFAAALAMVEQGDWKHAFERLAALADRGHVPSARLALTFARHGTRLFGGSFRASAVQRMDWSRLAG